MTNSILRPDKMNDNKWLNPRLFYLLSIRASTPVSCPECGETLKCTDDGDEEYCPSCGLVTSAAYPYVAGRLVNYPYGLRL